MKTIDNKQASSEASPNRIPDSIKQAMREYAEGEADSTMNWYTDGREFIADYDYMTDDDGCFYNFRVRMYQDGGYAEITVCEIAKFDEDGELVCDDYEPFEWRKLLSFAAPDEAERYGVTNAMFL